MILLLASCSGDAALDTVMRSTAPDGGYVNLHLVSSPSAVTRASEQEERAVYDGVLAVFEGTSAVTATLKSAVVIDQLVNNPGTGYAVNVTQRLPVGTHPYSGAKRYALALLNIAGTGLAVDGTELKYQGESLTGKDIAYFQSLVINTVGSTDEHVGLMMANTIKDDGNILRNIETYHLYDTPDAAAAGSRLTIGVERAAAKVRVSLASPSPVLNLYVNSAATPTAFSIHRLYWLPDRYKTAGYAVRNPSSTAAVSLTGYDADSFTLYPDHAYGDGDEVYVAENDESAADSQTRVVVGLQLKDASSVLLSTFYIYNGDKTRIFSSPAHAEAYVGAGFDASRLACYADGLVYYAYDILHDGEKKLLRNHSYQLTIRTLAALGSDTAP